MLSHGLGISPKCLSYAAEIRPSPIRLFTDHRGGLAQNAAQNQEATKQMDTRTNQKRFFAREDTRKCRWATFFKKVPETDSAWNTETRKLEL